jgi:hypothetical protein
MAHVDSHLQAASDRLSERHSPGPATPTSPPQQSPSAAAASARVLSLDFVMGSKEDVGFGITLEEYAARFSGPHRHESFYSWKPEPASP